MSKSMFKKNILLYLATLLTLTILLAGCPARRPAPEQPAPPQTIIVPEVARIFFTEVELEEGPQLARSLAANNRGGEMTVWFEENNNFWVMVQSDGESDEVLQIEEVLQRIPGRDTLLLEIRLNEKERGQAEEKDQAGEGQEQDRFGDVMLIKLDINQRPHGAAFLFDSRLEEALEEGNDRLAPEQAAPPAAKQAGPQAKAQAQPKPQEEQAFIQVQEPKPNSQVTSPVQVLGRARVPVGTIKMRLKNGNGEIMAESSTTVTALAPQIGNFSGVLSFSKPENETSGTLEVFVTNQKGEPDILLSVPVVIK